PEGTRSPRGRLGPFARGAAHIAIGAALDPIPVTLRCDPATLSGDVAWLKVPECLPTYTVQVGHPIPIGEAAGGGGSRAQASRSVTALLQDYFERQIDSGRD
ncbi:1-acyl-sn-glycerol-3-phosphate acyltransferase, partial [Myxococcota bacterium]|nr:1-acyl-sn-glycerol-3-phosphate acyltransferase [Myxococcota bacterium]